MQQMGASEEDHQVIFRALESHEGRFLGGGGGHIGVYGTLNLASTLKVLRCWSSIGISLDNGHVLDYGCGLARFLIHTMRHFPNLKAAYGVECDAVKCEKALSCLKHTAGMSNTFPPTEKIVIICNQDGDNDVVSLEPATHVYTCWQGFNDEDKRGLGLAFRASATAKVLTIVQKSSSDIQRELELLGFGRLDMVGDSPISVRLAGGCDQLQAYTMTKPFISFSPPLSVHVGLQLLPAFTLPTEELKPTRKNKPLDVVRNKQQGNAVSIFLKVRARRGDNVLNFIVSFHSFHFKAGTPVVKESLRQGRL